MDWQLAKTLTEIPGVYGFTEKITEEIQKHVSNFATVLDSNGNIIVKKGNPHIGLFAHMDEVGFIVSDILENHRSIKLIPVGGINLKNLKGNYLTVFDYSFNVSSYIYIEETEKTYVIGKPLKNLKKIEAGNMAVFDSAPLVNEKFIVSKALDDRIGCFLLINLLKSDLTNFYAVFTTGEEIGTYGASTVNLETKENLCVECTGAFEYPGADIKGPSLFHGPVVTVVDRVEKVDDTLVNKIKKTGDSFNIPYQFKQPFIGGTDCGRLKYRNKGTKTATIAVPARYIHSPYGITTLEDIEYTFKLLYTFLKENYG